MPVSLAAILVILVLAAEPAIYDRGCRVVRSDCQILSGYGGHRNQSPLGRFQHVPPARLEAARLALPLRPLTGLAQVQEPGGARCEARRSTLPASQGPYAPTAARRRWTTPRPSSRRAGSNGRRGAKMEEVE